MGGRYDVNFLKSILIRSGALMALREFYRGLVLFGLDRLSREFIYYTMYYRLKDSLSQNDKTGIKAAFLTLEVKWASS